MTARRSALFLAPFVVLLLGHDARAHRERDIASPPRTGAVPDLNRVSLHTLVVCKPTSKPSKAEHRDIHQRLATETGPALAQAQAEETAWHRNAKLFKKCRYEHIQAAVNAALNDTTIYVLPGVYREEPSRAAPTTTSGDLPNGAYSYAYHLANPNDANLIAILGKTNITLEGTGVSPRDVLIDGGFTKDVGIRCDKCTNFIVRNLWTRDVDEHAIYVVDSNGYAFDKTVGSYAKEYELFAFASDHGLFQDCEAEGGGDSGLYIGGHPDTHTLGRFSSTVQRCKLYHNALGFSGTQGNSVHMVQNEIYDNALGISFDSENDHPNFPQRYSVIEDNDIHDNNYDIYGPTSDVPVRGPGYDFFRYPVGTGMWIVGGENNVIQGNRIYGNQRFGVILAANPFESPLLAKVHRNEIRDNIFGKDAGGMLLPNSTAYPPGGDYAPGGSDVFWDETGLDNCFGPQDPGSGPVTLDPVSAPQPCPFPNGIDTIITPNLQKLFLLVSCSLTQVPGSNPPVYVTNDGAYPCPWGHENLAPYRSKNELECGNGDLDLGEDCDAGNGGYGGGATSETCERLALGTGTLACNDLCLYDTSGCSIQSCGRYGAARTRLKHLDAPAGDDEMEIALNDVDGSGRTFDPTTEDVTVVVREDPTPPDAPTLYYLRTIPAGSSWSSTPTSYVFADPPGTTTDALRVSLTTEGSFGGPFRAKVELRGASLGTVAGTDTATVGLRIGDDCWRGELPCDFSRTGRGGSCRKAKRP